MTYDLLSVNSDAKTVKGQKLDVLTGILYFAPSTEADGVHNMCPMATEECRSACLYESGRAGVFPTIKRARINKTLAYLANTEAFELRLGRDIERLIIDAANQGMTPAVRINGTSDLPQLALKLALRFPDVQFYDYTKIPRPWNRTLSNYHLTFSFSGENMQDCTEALLHGVNVSVVFGGSLPSTWRGFPVISGDDSDVRFKDPVGVIVGLTVKPNKGTKQMSAGGFIQLGKVA